MSYWNVLPFSGYSIKHEFKSNLKNEVLHNNILSSVMDKTICLALYTDESIFTSVGYLITKESLRKKGECSEVYSLRVNSNPDFPAQPLPTC